MDVPGWVWALTGGVVIAMLVADYLGHVRAVHEPSLREAARWSAAYVGIAVAFGIVVWAVWGTGPGGEYFAGYVTEKSLSVDNLFVFVLIMASFRVPRRYQQKVLLTGITVALVLRTAFIFLGAALIQHVTWMFYVFGAFLLYAAWTQLRAGEEDGEYHENAVLRLTRRLFHVTDDYVGDHLVVRRDGRSWITPMLVVMIAIGSADVMFAVDSIPAIFGLTQETYLVFAANAFSLLGLRQLFFLVDGLLDKLVYLAYGLAVILAFIGAKLVLHALHTNEVPFVNGGQHVAVPEISTATSLVVIVVVLAVTTAASLLRTRRGPAPVTATATATDEGPTPATPTDEDPAR